MKYVSVSREVLSALYAETLVSLVSSHSVVPTHSGVVTAHHGPPKSMCFLTESKFHPSPHTMCGQVLQRSIRFIICPHAALTMYRLLNPYKQDPQERLDKKKPYNVFFVCSFVRMCVSFSIKQRLPEVSEQTKVIIGVIIAEDLHCQLFNKETFKGERYLVGKKVAVVKRFSIPLSSKIIKGLMRSQDLMSKMRHQRKHSNLRSLTSDSGSCYVNCVRPPAAQPCCVFEAAPVGFGVIK